MTVLARFKRIAGEEVDYLRGRGAQDPERFSDGYRLADTTLKLPDHLMPSVAKLVICVASTVKMIESPCSVSRDGKLALQPWDTFVETFKEAKVSGEAV